MDRIRVSCPLLLFICLLLSTGGHALAASCTTSQCHDDMGKEEFVHGPAAVGDCGFCHIQKGDHSFESIDDVGALCLQCHDKVDTRSVGHFPVREGLCSDCHDPHQSPHRYQLRSSGADLCLLCHDESFAKGKFMHTPVADGGCGACHNVHSGDFPKLLPAVGNQVCFECHFDKAEEIQEDNVIHPPVADACVNCHDPHSSNYMYVLSGEGNEELCFQCHDDKNEEITASFVKHGGLTTETRCLACHDPHLSNQSRLLVMQPDELCLSCHDREYDKPSGTVADMKTYLAERPELHGPIGDNDCSSCHNPHGSSNFRILREPFPERFYAGYDPDNYSLCFMCHEETLAEEPSTLTMTGFRNGDQNLHYIHVNKTVKGRTCRACHDAHASRNPRHIRDAVPFNAWDLPIGFTKTQTGGACLPGCHQLFEYDREKPAKNR